MNKRIVHFVSICCLIAGAIPFAFGIDTNDTRMLASPAVSKDQIAFLYANDLWIADRDGKNPRRLTSDEGVETNPHFSPDGSLIAFTAQYDGNLDVFVVPSKGGIPTRLTWHPGPDLVRGFTTDGKAVLFASGRYDYSHRNQLRFYTVPVTGGFPTQLEIPKASEGSYSPDGKYMAYVPLNPPYRQWKNYRGGQISRIWVYNFKDHSVVEIPKPAGGCNDDEPQWIGDKIYFKSDRAGEFNLFSYDVKSKQVQQLTNHNDFSIKAMGSGDGVIIYEQSGYLHVFEPATGKSNRLKVGVAADLLELRERWDKVQLIIRNADLSPSGKRAVFEMRGEIITVPAEKGDPRNITQTTGVHERDPVWSPDGKHIAFFSDQSGAYALHLEPQDGKGETKKLKLNGSGFYFQPKWSPDSKKIVYRDNSLTIYYIDVETGDIVKVDQEPQYGPLANTDYNWSPDSRWLVYTLDVNGVNQTLFLYNLEDKKSHKITNGLSEVSEPTFDKSGKYLYFLSSTDAGPVREWFNQSNMDMSMRREIYMAVLAKDTPSPLFRESDEEEIKEEKKDENGDKAEKKDEQQAADKKDDAKKDGDADKDKKDEEKDRTKIDLDGLQDRILPMPLPRAGYYALSSGEEGEIFFIQAGNTGGGFLGFYGSGELKKFTFKDREATTIADNISTYQLGAQKKQLLVLTGRNNWSITGTGGKMTADKGKLNIADIRVKVNPPAEWRQIFNEAWRINDRYFYDPGFHGADWDGMRKKYSQFLPHIAVRNDLTRVIRWMCSELSVGHHYGGGGSAIANPEFIPVGLLGADWEVHENRYRTRKIYGGMNWSPNVHAPLNTAGVAMQEGEYLLSVNGRNLTADINLYSLFERTAGRIVELEIGPNANGEGSRTVKVEPLTNESALRIQDWVEGNIRRVDEATNGRAAYVWAPDTSAYGHTLFKRYFYPQAHKDAIIVDERFNSGGALPDYYINLLDKPFITNWAMRYGKDLTSPKSAFFGPKVMLIDETAGSGGDLFPFMFRQRNLGKLVGKRTWGGLVGILGFPTLMDGGSVTAPNIAIWNEDGWIIENYGVAPDIEVEMTPAEVIQGKDPQLEKAIEVILDELKDYKPKNTARPPFPKRAVRN